MAVPTGCRIAFSFTALLLTSFMVAYAVIRGHGRVSRAGHGIVALVAAGLAAASIYSAQSHEPVLNGITNDLLCAAIGASPLVQFETLNEALAPSGILPPYVLGCIILARALASLKIAIVITLMIEPHLSNILISVFLSGVTLEYAFLTVISFSLYEHRVHQIYPLSMVSTCFVSSILGFCFKDMDMLSWSLWALFLLISSFRGCLLLANEIKKRCIHAKTIARRYRAPEGIQLHSEILAPNAGTSASGSAQHLDYESKQFGHHGGQMLRNLVWWEIPVNDSRLSSSHDNCEAAQLHEEDTPTSHTRLSNLQELADGFYYHSTNDQQTTYHGQNAANIDAQEVQLIHPGGSGNEIRVTTDIRVDYEETAVCGAGYFTNAHGGYKWNLPWNRIGCVSHNDTGGTWETEIISCHWRRWPPGATVEQY